MDTHVQTLIAAAAGRARMLLEILDVEHTTEQLHQRARAVRTELDAIVELAGEHPPPPLPGLARPSGEQLGLDT